MKYTIELTINLTRDKVISQFDSMENMYKWQPGLKRHRFLSGEPGKDGSRTELIYESRRGEFSMIETITRNALPDEFHGIYQSRGIYNKMYNYFTEEGPDRTLWRTVSIFKFRGIVGIMSLFMRTAFRQQTLMSMEQFKFFCEGNLKSK